MKLPFSRKRKDRRLPENAELRVRWDEEHAVTSAEVRDESSARVNKVIDRAKEIADISAVVTIRTRPKRAANG